MQQRLRYRFSVYGQDIPVDHGEFLYAAISRQCPELHQMEDFHISPIVRTMAIDERLSLLPGSCFFARVPEAYLPQLVRICGKTLQLRDSLVRVGPLQVQLIQPVPALRSRIVTIKNALTEERMREKIEEALDTTRTSANIRILRRRIISIHGRKVVGFGIHLSDLTDEVSLSIQVAGLGGRRRFGCGVFLPESEVSGL